VRNYYRLILVLLSILFGVFYGYLTYVPTFPWSGLKDLMANILSALLIFLGIDWIVEKSAQTSKLQKSEYARRFVRNRIASVFLDLIRLMCPPENWRDRLKDSSASWHDYSQHIYEVRKTALDSLESLLDKYNYLIDDELVSSILQVIASLGDPILDVAGRPQKSTKEVIWEVAMFAHAIPVIMHRAIKAIEDHELLDYSTTTVMRWRKGEIPRVVRHRRKKGDIQALADLQRSEHEESLKESIEFRDEIERLVLGFK